MLSHKPAFIFQNKENRLKMRILSSSCLSVLLTTVSVVVLMRKHLMVVSRNFILESFIRICRNIIIF
jgi:hypothetical protein